MSFLEQLGAGAKQAADFTGFVHGLKPVPFKLTHSPPGRLEVSLHYT
jgi:hypothetical protein